MLRQVRPAGLKKAIPAIAIAILSLALPIGALAAQPADLQEAIKLYDAGKFSIALNKLENARGIESNSTARYYKGLCYVNLNQMSSAQSEFTWLYYNCKNASIRYKAWQGLQELDGYKAHRQYAGNGPIVKDRAKGPGGSALTAQAAGKDSGKLGDGWTMAGPGYGGTSTDIGMPAGWGSSKTRGCH